MNTIEHIDPVALVVEPNIRTSAPLDAGFITSIRANGVLTPILGWRDPDGIVQVRAGQRRTLAAREAGLPTVPVYVIDISDPDDARRIIEQLVENDQREALTDADRVQAWRALELEGLGAAAIAKRTGTHRDRVTTGLAVAASETATTLVVEVGLTLDQAAVLVEFEDDPALVADLTEVAGESPHYFPVAVQRARNERVRQAVREAAVVVEQQKGHRVIDERPAWNRPPYPLRNLVAADGGDVTVETVTGRDGVAVYLGVWDEEARPEYFIDDPAALGLTVRGGRDLAPAVATGPMTAEQKAERKALIANNKEWDAAEIVRREWLTAFLSRKTFPKDALTAIAISLTTGRFAIAQALGQGNSVAATLLGAGEGYGERVGGYLDAHPTRALQVLLAVTLGGIEESLSRESWRHPRVESASYLRTLAGWGYPLCPVELLAAAVETDHVESAATLS